MLNRREDYGGDLDAVVSEPSNAALVRAAGSGDMNALGALYARHHQNVYELCYRLLGDADAADDLTHESFLRVLRYGGGFDGRATVASWLYRLVRNRCLDFLSRERRDRDRKTAWAAHLETHTGEPLVDPVDDRQDLVRQALKRLPPEMREVLVLSRFGDLRYREIAEVCGISVANVKVRAHRAMNELRRIFKELENSHELR